MRILVLCPSRGRPDQAEAVRQGFEATVSGDTELRFVVDADDPSGPRYPRACAYTVSPPPGNMVAALNAAAMSFVDQYDVIGFIGDDHRFRTPKWDHTIAGVFATYGDGFVFGDDLAQRAQLPTQVFISSPIIKTLGWMALPTCRHLYVDNAWKTLGERANCLFYVPSVVIEHLHPAYGKGEWDEGHLRVNNKEMYDHDRAAYEEWLELDADIDAFAIRGAMIHA